MRLCFALAAVAGCGRYSFEPLDTSTGGGDGSGGTDPSLLLHYKFDDLPGDGVLDSSGKGHTGMCVNGCPGQGSTAKFDFAYIFNGSSTLLSVPDVADLRPLEITITAWVYLRAGVLQGLVQRTFGPDEQNSWQLAIDAGGGFVTCSIVGCSSPSPPLSLMTWHHVALVSSASYQDTYVDGVHVSGFASSLAWDASPILIGADRDFGAEFAFVDGNIDDVRIYGRALDENEIIALAAQ